MRFRERFGTMQEWLTPKRLRLIGFALLAIWGGLSAMYPGQHLAWLVVLASCILASAYIPNPIRKR